jgi:hypothetical protein
MHEMDSDAEEPANHPELQNQITNRMDEARNEEEDLPVKTSKKKKKRKSRSTRKKKKKPSGFEGLFFYSFIL